MGDGVKDIRCQLAPGRFEAPCWSPNFQDMESQQCVLTTDLPFCLQSGQSYGTEVRRAPGIAAVARPWQRRCWRLRQLRCWQARLLAGREGA